MVNHTVDTDPKVPLTSGGKTWKLAGKVTLVLVGILLAAPIIAANVSWILSGFESSPTSTKDHGVWLLLYFYTLPPALLLGLIAPVCFAIAWTKNKKE